MNYIPGQGTKKPLNMLEAPIYPDIKQAYPEFKWSKKYWQVDVGQTLLDTESQTQIYGDAILAKSYRDNIDSYGQSSHQEKITVFRPPLQNSYEDFGPLNRLPVKLHAIVPRINPGTTDSAGGTTAYAANNMINQEVSRYITDKVSNNSWHSTYYGPIDTSLDNIVLPDLETTLPSYSLYSGYQTRAFMDAPNPKSDWVIDRNNLPVSPVSAGYSFAFNADGDTRLNDLELIPTLPSHSVTAGINNLITHDAAVQSGDLILTRTLPTTPITSGFRSAHMFDGETQLTTIQLAEQLTTPLSILNPGSESGYQTRIDSYTSPQNYIKIRENPSVSANSGTTFNYREQNHKTNQPNFHSKLEPVKSYGNGLNSGTVKTAGINEQKVNGRYFGNKKMQQVY